MQKRAVFDAVTGSGIDSDVAVSSRGVAPDSGVAALSHYQRQTSEAADAAVSKEVFKLIKAGQYELAAVEAGKSDVTLDIWTKAVDAANI